MKEITAYEAFDGKIFSAEEACREYEKTIVDSVMMFRRNGIPTDDPESAHLVYLGGTIYDDENNEEKCMSAVRFIQMCKEAYSECNGIDNLSYGWYFWNEWEDRYTSIDTDVIEGLGKALEFSRQPF